MLTEPAHAADRLLAAIDRAGAPLCVGLDPVLHRLPAAIARGGGDGPAAGAALAAFCTAVIDAVAESAAAIKVQSACFERQGVAGVEALARTMDHARGRGLIVILDAKRGDIGISAEHYAAAAFDGAAPADWMTVNSYLGPDGLEPFLRPGRGAFALVRTSNPGADAIQALRLEDGTTVAEAVAEMIAQIGARSIGASGYSAMGAVVGATRPREAASLRALMPAQILLVPGVGAQGGRIDDLSGCFGTDGRGALITASRSITDAWRESESDWTAAVGEAAAALALALRRLLGR